jgi:hypothetical protein
MISNWIGSADCSATGLGGDADHAFQLELDSGTVLVNLDSLIDETIDTTQSHHAMFTGIQIHGPDTVTYVWPAASFAIIDGQRYEFPRG